MREEYVEKEVFFLIGPALGWRVFFRVSFGSAASGEFEFFESDTID
jgi:hypothetical protein